MIKDYRHLPYRPCVGVMLLNAKGQVFVAQRRDRFSEAWQMPQGGIDDGEDVRVAALRELGEETGIAPGKVRIIAESAQWLDYDLPQDLIGKLWKGKYRGQTQKWLVMEFLGDDDDINIETEHPEFSAWRWTDIHTLPDSIVPFKRALYEKLVQEFAHLAAGRD